MGSWSDQTLMATASGVRLAGLSELWQRTLGDPGITIAVLDGPCDLSHPSLIGAALTQMNFVGSGFAGGPAGQHGTHTASIIFGRHDGPVTGVAPLCRGLIIPIFRDAPHGGIAPCAQPDLARAIRAAANAGADVINVSAGQFSATGVASPVLVDAVRRCAREGRLIVAAAGNDGCPCLHVPGALPSVLAVGAMDEEGHPMDFSNWGSRYRDSGILAPGVDILGAVPGDGIAQRTGTSYATPIVSGVAGLLLSLQVKSGQAADARAVRAAMLESALGCEHGEIADCRRLLRGRLNVSGAVSRILEGARNMAQVQTIQRPASPAPATQGSMPSGPTSAAEHPSALEGNSDVDGAVERTSVPPTASGAVEPERNTSSAEGAGASRRGSWTERPGSPGRAQSPAAVTASQREDQLIYAIGDLDLDFGTLARLDSLQQNAETFNGGGRLDVRINGHFLRHLLGWREFLEEDEKKGRARAKGAEGPVFHAPHLYEAKAVIWVLRHDESPVYAIQPAGPYAEDAYLELARFLMEQEGYGERREARRDGAGPEQVFYPSLDTRNSSEPNRTRDKRGDPTRIVERVAIPGRLNGTVELFSGQVIPVIIPDMRGTRSWSMPSLLELHMTVDRQAAAQAEQARARTMRNLERIAQRFFEEVRNPGLAPEDRALNFVATQVYRMVPMLRDKFAEGFDPELESISVKPSPTCREDSECYDVETAFFDPNNVLRSKMVLARTIDVSDVVPVMLGEEREYRRR